MNIENWLKENDIHEYSTEGEAIKDLVDTLEKDYKKWENELNNDYSKIQIRNSRLSMRNVVLKGIILEAQKKVDNCTGDDGDCRHLHNELIKIFEGVR